MTTPDPQGAPSRRSVPERLATLGVSIDLFEEATAYAAEQARLNTDFDAPAMRGITFWSRVNRRLAEQLTDPTKTDPPWQRTRRDSILRVIHPGLTHAITAISGEGGVGDVDNPRVRSKNPKGQVMARLVEENSFYVEAHGQSVLATRDEVEFGRELESMPLWFFLYKQTNTGLKAELSLPVKMDGKYVNQWHERIPIPLHVDPGFDVSMRDRPDTGPAPQVDVEPREE
jgi:hypothetical protein